MKKILNIGLLFFTMLSMQNLSAGSLFDLTLTLTNDFQFNIQENENYSLRLTLSQGNKIQERLIIENANTNMKLIQKEKLCKDCKYIYFITAYDRSSTYGAQTNIILWQLNQTWKVFKTPFARGFLKKNSNGEYEITERWPYPKKTTYHFEQGKLIEIKSSNKCPLQEFKQFAEELDKTQIKSVDSLKENYKKTASEQSKQCRSILFGDFRHYYDKMAEAYITSAEEKLNEKYPLSAQKEKKYKAEFKKIGLRLDQSEGTYYVEADSAWFLKEFTSSLSDEWKKFLEQSSHEKKNRFMGDDAVMISWEDLEKRVIFWEKFLNDHPDFVKKSTVSDTLLLYSATYLKGSGNSPIYDWDTKKLKSDIRKSYENFLKQNTQSKYHDIVKSQYTILKDNAFKIDKKTSKKLDDNTTFL